MKHELPKYSILTKKSVLDIDCNKEDYEKEFNEIIEEQDKILPYSGICLIHFFNSAFFNESTEEMTINDAIECLAIKDGVDLVQFENKNKGFVAYYNTKINGFEIIKGEQK